MIITCQQNFHFPVFLKLKPFKTQRYFINDNNLDNGWSKEKGKSIHIYKS
jgi:hypothetical protein